MFRRRQHRLPKFPPDAEANFHRLCRELPASDVPSLLESLRRCVDEILLEAKHNALIQPPLIEALNSSAKFLLEQYEQFSVAQRRLIIGAVYYFAMNEDGSPDSALATGFDDDVRIMNYGLEELGVEGMFIDI